VAKPSFANLKLQFDLACTSLRAFTLGWPGSTQRGGRAAVERVKGLCERLKLFTSGPHAKAAAALVVSGRTRVTAAETRLALLRERRAGA
jgi:hypothetical protein